MAAPDESESKPVFTDPSRRLLPWLLSLTLVACGPGDDGDDDPLICLEPGPYPVSAVRSEDPGDCPADVPYEFNDQEVEPADRACGGDRAELSGYTGDGSAESCSYEGTVTLTVVSTTELTGHAKLRFRNCVEPGLECTANFDLRYVQTPE